MTTSYTLFVDSFQFEYFVFGTGPETMLAFHGFGEPAGDLKLLEIACGTTHTILAVNHLHHGNSQSKEAAATLEDTTLLHLVNALGKRHGFDRFSLFGYSLGGKIALKLFELLPGRVNSLILFAPDGIVLNRWYNLAIHYGLTRKLFLYIIRNPGGFFRLVRLLRRVRLISASLEKFVLLHMHSEEKRKMVYDVWYTHRLIVPDVERIKQAINRYQLPVYLFFGKRDQVIPPAIGAYFRKGIETHCILTLPDTGHLLITEKHMALLKEQLAGT